MDPSEAPPPSTLVDPDEVPPSGSAPPPSAPPPMVDYASPVYTCQPPAQNPAYTEYPYPPPLESPPGSYATYPLHPGGYPPPSQGVSVVTTAPAQQKSSHLGFQVVAFGSGLAYAAVGIGSIIALDYHMALAIFVPCLALSLALSGLAVLRATGRLPAGGTLATYGIPVCFQFFNIMWALTLFAAAGLADSLCEDDGNEDDCDDRSVAWTRAYFFVSLVGTIVQCVLMCWDTACQTGRREPLRPQVMLFASPPPPPS